MFRANLVLVTLLFLLFSSNVEAQDTVRVFFDFGKSQLTKDAKSTLQSLPNQYDLTTPDSIVFIGYADSVGRINANIRLSLKRAKNVRKYISSFLKEDVITPIYAKGEDTQKSDAFGRRVAMILYYPEASVNTDSSLDVITDVDPKCFKIAMYALSYCNVSEIEKRNRKYARLEAENIALISDQDYYYLREYRDGRTEAKRVRWKETVTGKLWWKRKRLVAEIPRNSFEKSNFFTLDTGDCSNCNLGNLIDEDTVIKYVERTVADAFLMSNIQVKRRWFKRSTYKVRAPVEYINLDKSYYSSFDYDACDFFNLTLINWETKRGRRRRSFYFADIRTENGEIPYITSKVVLLECYERNCSWTGVWGGCYNPRRCGNFFGGLKPYIGIQAGMVHQNDSTMGYIGARIGATNANMNYSIDIGLNTNVGLFANATADYKIAYFGERYFGQKGKWISPNSIQPELRSYQYLYTGIATKLSTRRDNLSYFETNAHLGWGWGSTQSIVINRMFLEGGIARDWTGQSSTEFYPFFHAGVRLDF